MNELITPELLNTGLKVLGLGIVTKALEGPIQTINDVWGLIGGDKLHAKRLECQKKYAEAIVEKVAAIPPEKIVEPKLSILGPAIEASKYYIEEAKIRELFANLIAASMNSDTEDKIPHSFVEIIKQLSPYDAQLFKSFVKGTYPYGSIRLNKKGDTTGYYLFQNYYVDENFLDYEKNAISLLNLQKQGLIVIDSSYTLTDKTLYSFLESSEFFKVQKTIYSSIDEYKDSEVVLKHGAFHITELGKLFQKICMK